MAMADEQPLTGGVEDEAYTKVLLGVLWRPGYTVPTRVAAFERLERRDLPKLKRTLRQKLPLMSATAGADRLCELIAERDWTDLTPAIVSRWSRPSALAPDDRDRAEYKALCSMYGADQVTDVVFDLLITSRRVSDQGLRTRCWELLLRLNERERLLALLREAEIPGDDLFLLDLRRGAVDLDIIPANRQEILWMRELCRPERAGFWDEAVAAVAAMPGRRRREMELRDLPIVVSAARHDPELLTASTSELYDRLERRLEGQKHYSHGSSFDSPVSRRRETLRQWRDDLEWGDLAAMLIATRALDVPQVVDHLFDYAERDRLDETTEYGGIIQLDRRGRFEILEFPPRVRYHDQQFNAPQEMFDAGYTALFHFHFHVQSHRNQDYAGPGFGDENYAENTRANCLVMTFVRKGVLNVDFYRHGGVLVDLGCVDRPVTTARTDADRP